MVIIILVSAAFFVHLELFNILLVLSIVLLTESNGKYLFSEVILTEGKRRISLVVNHSGETEMQVGLHWQFRFLPDKMIVNAIFTVIKKLSMF